MAYEVKTKPTDQDVGAFIEAIEHEGRRADCLALDTLIQKQTGLRPKVWGTSLIGYGQYHYINRSGIEADWPLIAIGPGKQRLSVHIMPGFIAFQEQLAKLGPHKTGAGCLYITRLERIDVEVLAAMVSQSVEMMKQNYEWKP